MKVGKKIAYWDVIYRGVGYRDVLDEFEVTLVLIQEVDTVVSEQYEHRVVIPICVANSWYIHLVNKMSTQDKMNKKLL
jgi:hypothetical protein